VPLVSLPIEKTFDGDEAAAIEEGLDKEAYLHDGF
jgi:hypothetical protein